MGCLVPGEGAISPTESSLRSQAGGGWEKAIRAATHLMSENEEKQKKPRRKRRQFTPEFKAGAVKLVLAEGKSSTSEGPRWPRAA